MQHSEQGRGGRSRNLGVGGSGKTCACHSIVSSDVDRIPTEYGGPGRRSGRSLELVVKRRWVCPPVVLVIASCVSGDCAGERCQKTGPAGVWVIGPTKAIAPPSG